MSRNSDFESDSLFYRMKEDTWQVIFRESKREYRDPKFVLFTGTTSTVCGAGKAGMGPFYCSLDEKVTNFGAI